MNKEAIDEFMNRDGGRRGPVEKGVYAIIHKEIGPVYVGSSGDMCGRMRSHIAALNKGETHGR